MIRDNITKLNSMRFQDNKLSLDHLNPLPYTLPFIMIPIIMSFFSSFIYVMFAGVNPEYTVQLKYVVYICLTFTILSYLSFKFIENMQVKLQNKDRDKLEFLKREYKLIECKETITALSVLVSDLHKNKVFTYNSNGFHSVISIKKFSKALKKRVKVLKAADKDATKKTSKEVKKFLKTL